ncbi:MAG: endonuclease/exonuclease/phosphatase family protein [Thermoguttaceae bacterium]|nr:endonuclease/exonuclease/phosphatase family protein [Thermoguttaceae bacterium]MBQ9798396.1 endonuclease/exonuclease/phosphatase family protein [Thermoguttaceae bacterium]
MGMTRICGTAALALAALVSASTFARESDGGEETKKAEQTLRVAFFNVEFGERATPTAIGEMFKEYAPDVVGFNEVPGGDWTARVGAALGYRYYYTGKISSANNFDKYKSILSRYPISDFREIELNAEGGWNPASAVGATIDVDGRKVSIYSTHLCFNVAADDHAKRLVDALEASDANDLIIVGGDFNCKTEHTSGVKHFFDKGYKNIWLELGIETEGRFTYSAINPKDRDLGVIDQIVFRGDARATDGGMIELYPALSDHKPIWLEIKF